MKALFSGLAVTLLAVYVQAAIPFADGESVTFLNKHHLKMHGLLFKAQQPKAVLIAIHGMQSHSGWFFSGPELAEQGITTLAYDRLGSGLSEGKRGHTYTGDDFLDDLSAAIRKAKELEPDLPIHLHANCFGVRIAIPYLVERDLLTEVRSVIFTAPGVAMSAQADFSFSEKLCIPLIANGFALGNCAALSPEPFYVRSPLEDTLFVSNGPWLTDFVNTDPYALRATTASFLMAAKQLTERMNGAIQNQKFKTPMLMVLGQNDAMVKNAKINQLLYVPHSSDKKRLVLPCEHVLDFCGEASVNVYRNAMAEWILSH